MARRIIIADDHPLMRGAIRAAVEKVWPDYPIVEVSDAAGARTELGQGQVEVLTLDLHMADSAGLTTLMELRKSWPAVPVVVISALEDRQVVAGAREFGASAFIAKTASLGEMSEALAAVRDGEMRFPEMDGGDERHAIAERLAGLTPAQTRILGYVSVGLLNKQIAHEMRISEATVKAHITAIFRRLGVTNRTQAVLFAKQIDTSETGSDAGVEPRIDQRAQRGRTDGLD